MLIVPLQAKPSQSLNISLNGQACTLNVYAAGFDQSVYVDLYVSGSLIEGGMYGLIGVRMVRDSYLGFLGDIVFNDTQPDPVLGPQNPRFQGLASRWQLLYLFPGELTGDV